ncbi:MAG: cyclic nucleotide-binding domain-containing protein [Pseudomonadota bacterium]
MRSRQNSKVDAIAHVPLFSAASRSELQKIASIADEIDLREGKEMTREGAPGREFFVLVDGTADVRRKGRKIRSLGPGDFFGEIALVSSKPRTATVTATSPVRALVITERSFKRLLEEQPAIGAKVMRALAERVMDDNL